MRTSPSSPADRHPRAEANAARRSALVVLIALCVTLALARGARAQGMPELVDAALDQRVTTRIELPEQPIGEALAALAAPTGLTFDVDPRALEWMPYGENTRVAITIDNLSVRAALTRIFDGLGLAMRVTERGVAVEPSAMLARLGRRLTTAEVELLQTLAAAPWSDVAGPQIRVAFRLPADDRNVEHFDRALRDAPETNALAQLHAVSQRFGWVWVVDGRGIVISSLAEDIQHRLDRPIDCSYRRTPLDDLLLDLGRRIGMTVQFEPGVLSRVSARDRKVDLIQRDTTVRQVLELLVGSTGLVYEVTPVGIMIGSPKVPGRPDGAALTSTDSGTRVVAIVRIPVGGDA